MATTTLPPSLSPAPRLEIRDFRLVLAVASEGSLTRAGRRLNVTQPALSRHLGILESRLGAPLFVRTGQRMRATPAGELLVRHARDVLERVAGAETELHTLGETPRRIIRVGTSCYTGYHWLPAVLDRFNARHPDVEVEIAFEAARIPMKLLRAGRIDVALLTDASLAGAITTTRLFSDELVAVVAPGHPLATRAYLEPADFANYRLLLLAPPAQSSVMQLFINPAGVKPKSAVDVQLVGGLAALVAAQFGIGVLPSWTVGPEVRSGRLVPLRLGRSGLKRNWVAAVPQARAKETWLRDFVQSIATSGPALNLQP